MTPRGGARDGAGRPPRTEPKSRPIWCGQMGEDDRALIVATLTPAERLDALLDAVLVKLDIMNMKGEDMNEQVMAQGLIAEQGVATIGDYGGSVRRYINALMELAEENGWLKDANRDDLRKWLRYYLHS